MNRSARPIALAAALATLLPTSAFADKLLVLKADGRADAKTRARVDVAIAKLAGAGSGTDQRAAGEITYTDAAAMAGCQPEQPTCREEVIGVLGVDEIVTVTVSPRPGGFDVQVRRAGKHGASRDASALVGADGLDRLDAIGPLFGSMGATGPTGSTAPTGPTGPSGPTPGPTGPTAEPTATDPALSTSPTSATTATTPELTATTTTTTTTTTKVEESPLGVHDLVGGEPDGLGGRTSRLELAGMVGGGVLLVVGGVFWGSASSTQGEIDAAPTSTQADLDALKNLETRGDRYATAGNVLFVSGVVLGGLSTVLYLRHRRGHGRSTAATARVVPTVMGSRGGIGLTIGGTL